MLWKKAARVALHNMGGLAVLRSRHRREFGVLMFHSFSEQDRTNLEAICSEIVRHFEPVALSDMLDVLDGRKVLPDNAITVTVDDGYRSFFLHGQPVFRRHRIPATVYAVTGFSNGQLWLWPDQIEFGLRQTRQSSIRGPLGDGQPLEFAAGTREEKTESITRLTDTLKEISNDRRISYLGEFGRLCGVEIPHDPPKGYEAMSWDELRAVAADGTEVGCHTETHPSLPQLSNQLELESEIRGAKEHMKEHLGFDVRHFCYPFGRAGEAAIRCVREAGFASAVSCLWGFNGTNADRFQIRRIPFDSKTDLDYGKELLAGLHM